MNFRLGPDPAEPGPNLVSTGWLAAHLHDPVVRIAEIRSEREDPGYLDAHIPGAVSWFWKDIFWDTLSREFATSDQVAQRLSRYGISERTVLVLYSSRIQFAVYGYWVLTAMCGHPDSRILDGGLAKWLAEGRPASAEIPPVRTVGYRPARRERDDSTRIARDGVLGLIGAPGTLIIDARSAEEYAGLRVKPAPGIDHGAERAGHIPGAVHVPVPELLAPDGTFRSAPEIEEVFRRAGAAPNQVKEVITYCRLGHRASMTWFAMSRILDWDHARVYDGSWTEWGSCVGMPVLRDGVPRNGQGEW